ncbi:MAG: 5-amino-6-(D-ribitylamino)uracil--L-tyrosine 4-hydroxyphenyl transferase CofH [Acidimicrobiia bacterium]|nr:5-amino-6-(D-ribitylamino)uracil--L-tyrosine 4-hydroxyphenyl transferase CofH [Acidimicrobiia bacterium]
MITFLRVRPAESVHELTATTRRKEGTTALEVQELADADRQACLAGGILPVETRRTDGAPAAWVVDAIGAIRLSDLGVPGWRVTLLDGGDRAPVLDALARSQAAFLRTGRSKVADAVTLTSLPGLTTVVSVFVDTVEDALLACAAGAGDLLLRDWTDDQIGHLRTGLDDDLVERTAVPVFVTVDEARTGLPDDVFTTWLNLVDGAGRARPRTTWAPGKDEPPPIPPHRFSSQWPDEAWTSQEAPGAMEGSGTLRPILERSLAGTPPTRSELIALFSAHGDQVDAIALVADELRSRTVGDPVSYVVNRNINYTNMCYFRCGFCAFSKGPRSLNLRGDPYLMGVPEIVGWAREAWDRGATEVTLQGGIHPEFTGDFYVSVVDGIKSELPDMHIHGFTPLEVWQGAETLGVPVAAFLERLRDAGLGSLPGTAAEILDDRVRAHLCPDKIRTSQWAEVMITAHELGLPATATVMFGHIDDPTSWANHYEVIRSIQRRTGGFTEFVPLSFVHMGAPIWLRGLARPGPTWDEVVLIHAIARIAFDGLIPNIQASWVKLGTDGATRLLGAGCNDLGGTLMGEIITRSAGASHGQELAPADFERAIREAGRTPVRRNTLYGILEQA